MLLCEGVGKATPARLGLPEPCSMLAFKVALATNVIGNELHKPPIGKKEAPRSLSLQVTVSNMVYHLSA